MVLHQTLSLSCAVCSPREQQPPPAFLSGFTQRDLHILWSVSFFARWKFTEAAEYKYLTSGKIEVNYLGMQVNPWSDIIENLSSRSWMNGWNSYAVWCCFFQRSNGLQLFSWHPEHRDEVFPAFQCQWPQFLIPLWIVVRFMHGSALPEWQSVLVYWQSTGTDITKWETRK